MEEKSLSTVSKGIRGASIYYCKARNEELKTVDDISLVINEEVYSPSHDSFMLAYEASFLAYRLCKNMPITFIEIGSGSGIVSLYLVKQMLKNGCYNVFGILTDISPCAVLSSRDSAKSNDLDTYLDVVQCDSVSCLRSEIARTVLFNPPYLPVNEYESWLEVAWSGGEKGINTWSKFFKDSIQVCLRGCYMVFVFSTLQDTLAIFAELEKACEDIDIASCESFFYETICVAICRLGA